MGVDLTAGTEVADRFRLTRLVGEGGMGSVWLAEDLRSGSMVALKFVKEAVASPKLRRRLLREAKAACTVSHPCVVEVHDILELDDGAPVMVMEFLEGESLAERLERVEALSIDAFAPIMQQVVSAVGAAHALGVVHRDIKPENIFLCERVDGALEVKILDFGIAKLAPSQLEAGHSTELTKTGALVGTPCYMAPEQVYGENDVDCRADVWALGLIMYRALSGILPTQAENVGQVMKIITARRIWPLADAGPELPGDVTRLVDRMLSREREDRPASLHEVRELLSRYTDIETPSFDEPQLAPSREDRESLPSRRAIHIHSQADPMGETSPAKAGTGATSGTRQGRGAGGAADEGVDEAFSADDAPKTAAARRATSRTRRARLLLGLAAVMAGAAGWWAWRGLDEPVSGASASAVPAVENPAVVAMSPEPEPDHAEVEAMLASAAPKSSSEPAAATAQPTTFTTTARAPQYPVVATPPPESSVQAVASAAPAAGDEPDQGKLGAGRTAVVPPF